MKKLLVAASLLAFNAQANNLPTLTLEDVKGMKKIEYFSKAEIEELKKPGMYEKSIEMDREFKKRFKKLLNEDLEGDKSNFVIIPANALGCGGKERFKEAMEYIYSQQGQNISLARLDRLGCKVYPRAQRGVLVKGDNDGYINRVAYEYHLNRESISLRYFDISILTRLSDYLDNEERTKRALRNRYK